MDTVLLIQIGLLLVSGALLVTVLVGLRVTGKVLKDHSTSVDRFASTNVDLLNAYRELLELTRSAYEQQSTQVERRILAEIQPHLLPDLKQERGSLSITLTNVGVAPAYDVHLTILVAWDNTETAFVPFVRTYIRPEVHAALPSIPDGEKVPFSVVYERTYPAFATGTRVLYPLYLPVLPRAVYLLVQCRDAEGNPFGQLSRYGTSARPDDRAQASYTLAYRKPHALGPTTGVSMIEVSGRMVLMPAGEYVVGGTNGEARLYRLDGDREQPVDLHATHSLPDLVRDDLLQSALDHSIPARYLLREFAASSDREQWFR